MNSALLQALYGPASDETDVADAEDLLGGLSGGGEEDGNNDRMQGAAPTMATALNGAPESPEAAASGTGPNPTGQVLARLRPPQGSNPYENSFGSSLAAGMGAVQPGMGKGSALAHGFVGSLAAGENANQKAALYDDAQQLKNLQAIKTLFDMQKSSEQLKEAYRYHNLKAAGGGAGPKPQWHQTGVDEFNQPKYGWVFPPSAPGGAQPAARGNGGVWDRVAAGDAPAAGAEGGARSPMGFNYALKGEPFLKDAVSTGAMTEAEANQIRSYAAGKIPFPSSKIGARDKKLIEAYDPNYDVTKYPGRKNMVDAWTKTGPNQTGGRIESGKRAIDHLEMISDAAEKLKGLDNSLLNMGRNLILQGSGGHLGEWAKQHGLAPEQAEALRTLTTATDVFAKEAEKFYRGAAGAQKAIEDMKRNLDPSQPPNMLHAGIAANIGLMRGQFDEMLTGWHDIMGDQKPPRDPYDAKMQRRMDRMYRRAGQKFTMDGEEGAAPQAAPAPQTGGGATPSRGTGATPAAGGGQQPVRVRTPDEARKLPSGTPIMLPDGSIGRVP